jgi:predicted amidophosphoribosyltransferase
MEEAPRCSHCGKALQQVTLCQHCGQELHPVMFFLHPQLHEELTWLLVNRKAIADEQSIDDVLSRLIKLEVDKRKRIEAAKAKRKK